MSDISRRVAEPHTELPTFTVFIDAVAIGNNKSMISLLNTGNKIVTLREVYIQNNQTSAITGVIAKLGVFGITAHSAGTSLTASSRDTNDSLDGGITIRTGATVTEVGAVKRRWYISTDEWGTGTLDVEANQAMFLNSFPLYRQEGLQVKGVVLRTNQGISLKCETNSTNGNLDIFAVFTVE